MDAQLWRLAWALPLVLAIGLALILWLKKLGLGGNAAAPGIGAEPRVLSNAALTDHTRVLVVEVGAQSFVVFESTAHLSVQAASVDGSLPNARPSMASMQSVFPWRPTGRKS